MNTDMKVFNDEKLINMQYFTIKQFWNTKFVLMLFLTESLYKDTYKTFCSIIHVTKLEALLVCERVS